MKPFKNLSSKNDQIFGERFATLAQIIQERFYFLPDQMNRS